MPVAYLSSTSDRRENLKVKPREHSKRNMKPGDIQNGTNSGEETGTRCRSGAAAPKCGIGNERLRARILSRLAYGAVKLGREKGLTLLYCAMTATVVSPKNDAQTHVPVQYMSPTVSYVLYVIKFGPRKLLVMTAILTLYVCRVTLAEEPGERLIALRQPVPV